MMLISALASRINFPTELRFPCNLTGGGGGWHANSLECRFTKYTLPHKNAKNTEKKKEEYKHL